MNEGNPMVQGMGRRERCYVEVLARFGADGSCRPTAIILDGRTYPIDQVVNVHHVAVPDRPGSHQTRYAIRVRGKLTYAWRDEAGWYVERIVYDDSAPSTRAR